MHLIIWHCILNEQTAQVKITFEATKFLILLFKAEHNNIKSSLSIDHLKPLKSLWKLLITQKSIINARANHLMLGTYKISSQTRQKDKSHKTIINKILM